MSPDEPAALRSAPFPKIRERQDRRLRPHAFFAVACISHWIVRRDTQGFAACALCSADKCPNGIPVIQDIELRPYRLGAAPQISSMLRFETVLATMIALAAAARAQ